MDPAGTTDLKRRYLPLEATVDRLYRNRFLPTMLERRNDVRKILCRSWFSHYIPQDAAVLEIGAGDCEFHQQCGGGGAGGGRP